ncbi:hypothetical protein J437_LFUL001586, partial [Ladona fulva]
MKVIVKLKDTVKEKQLIITKADKGNCVVILAQSDYISKYNEFIRNNNILPISQDPTPNHQQVNRKMIQNSVLVSNLPDFTLPELHKTGFPIRPVVYGISSQSHKLAEKVNNLILKYSKFSPKYAIKNSVELCNKLKPLAPPSNAKLVSFK